MKNVLYGAVAAIALVGFVTPAAAQTNTTQTGTSGTVYTAQASAPANSEATQTTVDTVFTLTGSVNSDCSFYSGNDAAALNINFGVIGVRTGNNENVNDAFEMVGPAVANIETMTAGCNTNNRVKIDKSTADGMVNSATVAFDSNQFQINIPYSVDATWTGVSLANSTQVGSAGTSQTLNVPTGNKNSSKTQGAWRSNMNINITAPAVTAKGLVAGNYEGTVKVTLSVVA